MLQSGKHCTIVNLLHLIHCFQVHNLSSRHIFLLTIDPIEFHPSTSSNNSFSLGFIARLVVEGQLLNFTFHTRDSSGVANVTLQQAFENKQRLTLYPPLGLLGAALPANNSNYILYLSKMLQLIYLHSRVYCSSLSPPVR